MDLATKDLNTKSGEMISATWDAELGIMSYERHFFIKEGDKMKRKNTIRLNEHDARQRAQSIMNSMLNR